MYLMSLISVFTASWFAMLGIVKFYNFPELQEALGDTVFWAGIVFGVILTYFIIYLFVQAIRYIADSKKEKEEY